MSGKHKDTKTIRKLSKKQHKKLYKEKTKKTSKSLNTKYSNPLEPSTSKRSRFLWNNNAQRLSEIDDLDLEQYNPDQLLQIFGEQLYDFYPTESYLNRPRRFELCSDDELFGESEMEDQIRYEMARQNIGMQEEQPDDYFQPNYDDQPLMNDEQSVFKEDQILEPPNLDQFQQQPDYNSDPNYFQDDVSSYDDYSQDSHVDFQTGAHGDGYAAVQPYGDQTIQPNYDYIPTAQPNLESYSAARPIYQHRMPVEEPQQYVSGPLGSLVPIPRQIPRPPMPPVSCANPCMVPQSNGPPVLLIQPTPGGPYFIVPAYLPQNPQPGLLQPAQPNDSQLMQPSNLQLAPPPNLQLAPPPNIQLGSSNPILAQPDYMSQQTFGNQFQTQPDIDDQFSGNQPDYGDSFQPDMNDQYTGGFPDFGDQNPSTPPRGQLKVDGVQGDYDKDDEYYDFKQFTAEDFLEGQRCLVLTNPYYDFKLTPLLTNPVYKPKKSKGVTEMDFYVFGTSVKNNEDANMVFNYLNDICDLEAEVEFDYLYKMHDYINSWWPWRDEYKTVGQVEAERKSQKKDSVEEKPSDKNNRGSTQSLEKEKSNKKIIKRTKSV